MKLMFKQRFFSWFDSYDIYNEAGETVYTVKGQLAWGHLLKIYDAQGCEVGTVKQKVLTWLPKFELYLGDKYLGCISKEFTLFSHKFNIDYNGWHIDGDWLGWDYSVIDSSGQTVAQISKELWNWTDTYVIDVYDPTDGLCTLMLVLAIDAEKCSSSSN
ncbi:MAG: LURP-one-related family protein [Clostridia bacterium]|nr:LURP-one-related family protein [Clostridia bacterium]